MIQQALAGSVVGARHRRLGAACEDAAGWALAGPRAGLVGVVADGHGDPRCSRSQVGARFAVSTAAQAVAEWEADPVHRAHRGALVSRVVDRWRAAVDQDLALRPAHADELAIPVPRLLYGTTVIVAAADDMNLTVLRIGDGDVVGVHGDGSADRLLGADRVAVPGQTYSLSDDHAERLARSRTIARADAPALIVLVTDGVSDAYSDDAGLLTACRELHELWRDGGQEHAEASMSAWLREAAEHSGDDASAVAIRLWPDR